MNGGRRFAGFGERRKMNTCICRKQWNASGKGEEKLDNKGRTSLGRLQVELKEGNGTNH